MTEVTQYDESWFRYLENIKAVDLLKSEHGFNYTRDVDRDSLDHSTIFNTLLKTKRYRGLEFKKGWVQIKVADDGGVYYLLSYDLRIKEEVNAIMKLSSPTDNILIAHIKKITNPVRFSFEKDINSSLLNILENKLNSLSIDPSTILENADENVCEFTATLSNNFQISIFFDKKIDITDDTHSATISINSLNGDLYYINTYDVKSVLDFEKNIIADLQEISDIIKEAGRNNSIEELVTKKTKEQKSFKQSTGKSTKISSVGMKKFIIKERAVGGIFAGKSFTDIKEFKSLDDAEKFKNERNSNERENIKIISIKEIV